MNMIWLSLIGLAGAGILGFWGGHKSAGAMDTLWILVALTGGVVIGSVVTKD